MHSPRRTLKAALGAAALLTATASAQSNIFSPGNPIFGGRSDGTNFLIGTTGNDGGNANYTDNVWPAGPPGEGPNFIIDGFGQKYLNFAELNTGFVITPSFNGGLGSVATSMKLWSANDAPERDPTSYILYGTNLTISGPGPFPVNNFTMISSGAITLPASRNGGGVATPLLDTNSTTINFVNTAGYTSYMVIFPTVANEPAANSMQIAEVQLMGTAIPEPGSAMLLGAAAFGLVARRRRQ